MGGQFQTWPVLACAAAMATGAARAESPPETVTRMIEAAADDPATLEAIARVAKKVHPSAAAEIDAQVALARAQTAARKSQIAGRSFFDGWTGKGEFGGNVSTGNTDEEGLALGLELEKDSARWRHSLDATADVKREDGELSKERYFLSVSSQYKLSRRLYAVGVLWGEGDQFAGYRSRFSESLGLGYRLIDTPDVKLRVEAGPALRQADYIDTGTVTSGSVRLAQHLSWKFGGGTEFTQRAIAYLESGNSTLIGSMALTARIYESLAGRASYEVRHESKPPRDRETTDTTGRVTLVYSF